MNKSLKASMDYPLQICRIAISDCGPAVTTGRFRLTRTSVTTVTGVDFFQAREIRIPGGESGKCCRWSTTDF